MNVFNSLGSNYNFEFAMAALLSGSSAEFSNELKKYLENKYSGKATLVYKGREAILLALESLHLPKNSVVAINGYTCYAVFKAISDAGYRTSYIDIEEGGLNFSAEALTLFLEKNSETKVVIVQNTLGFPCDALAISEICKQKNIVLVEDLAHSAGAIYSNGTEAGSLGDFVVLSFSQDKIVDAVSGGALVTRNENFTVQDVRNTDLVPTSRQLVDRFYPVLTWKIRALYAVGLGKVLHALLKQMGVLSKPLTDLEKIVLRKFPSRLGPLVRIQYLKLPENIDHRRGVAEVYASTLNKQLAFPKLFKQIQSSACLRFPILVENRQSLVEYLSGRGVHVSDIWYDAPVAPEKYMGQTNYQNECPISERISKRMLNLPTHRNVTIEQAKEIAEHINTWLTLR